jgi:hypothetical protein
MKQQSMHRGIARCLPAAALVAGLAALPAGARADLVTYYSLMPTPDVMPGEVFTMPAPTWSLQIFDPVRSVGPSEIVRFRARLSVAANSSFAFDTASNTAFFFWTSVFAPFSIGNVTGGAYELDIGPLGVLGPPDRLFADAVQIEPGAFLDVDLFSLVPPIGGARPGAHGTSVIWGDQSGLAGLSGQQEISVLVRAVPEPATLALLVCGLAAACTAGRRAARR